MLGRRQRPRSFEAMASLAACLLLLGCGDARPRAGDAAPDAPEASRGAAAAPAPAARDESAPTVVFLGDSLTAGYGVDEDQAFPALVARALAAEGRPIRLVNAGVSGDTTAGGLARLDWLLKQKPDVLVVGLGGNDGLRGLDPEMSEANLRRIVERAKGAGVVVVLLGMLMPPNYGPQYTEQFSAIYPRVAEADDAILVPFLLEGVGGEPRLNQPDGIHPNVEGHEIVARTVLPYVREALDEAARGDAGADEDASSGRQAGGAPAGSPLKKSFGSVRRTRSPISRLPEGAYDSTRGPGMRRSEAHRPAPRGGGAGLV